MLATVNHTSGIHLFISFVLPRHICVAAWFDGQYAYGITRYTT